jgi:hypothetical protein
MAYSNREMLEAAASEAQAAAANAHYVAVTARAADCPESAGQWQGEQAREAARAAALVTQILEAPEAWLEFEP